MTIQIAPAKNIISLCHPLSRIKLGFGLYYSKFNLYLFFKCPVGTLQIWLRHSHARNIKQGISNDDVLLSAFINRDTFACRFFDKEGERQVTLYTAAAPEYGKKTFLQHLDNEVSKMKDRYPRAHFVSLADGAKDNWDFLETRTDTQIIDFYHVTE